MILETIIGSSNRERVLLFLQAREEGYAREIARFFETDLSPIQDQLEKLEAGGVIVSKKVGRTILYSFNPRYALLKELKLLLNKAISFYPEDLQEKLLMNRRLPRRHGKPD
ncbi:winged helix-turn-helix domain-containing protein [Chloroflexota bacterium]